MQDQRLKSLQEQFFTSITKENNFFLKSIIPIGSLSASECVEIYSRGYFARLTEALGETFEATWWVVGDREFFGLCQRCVKERPSSYFDLSEYGLEFLEFLSRQDLAKELPFLNDLAKFEWQFKDIFHKKNLVPLMGDRSVINSSNINLTLTLSPSATLFESQFSVYEIWKNRVKSVGCLISIDLDQEEKLVVFKQDSQVYVQKLKAEEYLLISILKEKKPLEQALESLFALCPTIASDNLQKYFANIRHLLIIE